MTGTLTSTVPGKLLIKPAIGSARRTTRDPATANAPT